MHRKLLIVAVLLLALTSGVAMAQDAVIPVVTATSNSFAAWQPFQRGVMMWWSDSDQIWVMVHGANASSGAIAVYTDGWNEGDNVGGGNAPAGFFAPERGFGRVWRQRNLESALGWAFTPELGYDTAGRSVGAGGEIIIDGPGNTVYGVTFIPQTNTGVWRVIRIA